MLQSDIDEIVDSLPSSFWGQFAGKRVLLTGGRGFLGRYFTEVFVRVNERVFGPANWRPVELVVLDNLITAGEYGSELTRRPNVAFVNHDVIVPFTPERPVDYIIHAAGIASPAWYRKHPIETYQVAVKGTENVLEIARKSGKQCRVLYFSSSEIYGDPDVANVPTKEGYKGHVACLGPRACYSSDTEVMTDSGWKFFTDLTAEDKIASLSEDHRVEYVTPTEIISQPFAGEMVHFANSKMDLLVTPNHQMIDERNGRQFVQADAEVDWRHRRVPVGGVWPDHLTSEQWDLPKPKRNAKVCFPSVPIEAWLEFVGVYLAEGCVCYSHSKREISGTTYERDQPVVLIAHDHGWKYEKIKACLEKLPWKFQERDHQFALSTLQLAEALAPLGRRSLEKSVPRDYLDLPPSMLRILFDGMMLDGSRDGRAFHTSSKALADAAQEIAIKLGMAATITAYFQETNPFNTENERYRVNLRPAVKAKYPHPERVPYNGTVHCVDLPPHRTLLVRRNGKAVFGSNCYDSSKRMAETIVEIYSQRHGVQASIVRPFNVYGPSMQRQDYRVLPNFAARWVDGEPLHVYGTGQQTRTFCYVTDAIRGFLQVLSNGLPGEPYNVGNPTPEISMRDLALLVGEVTGSEVTFDTVGHPDSYPADEPQRRCPNIDKARALGYEPKVSLKDGLTRFFGWAAEAYKQADKRGDKAA